VAVGPCRRFHLLEPPLKLVGGTLQGPLGRESHLPPQVGQREQDVPVLVLDFGALQSVLRHRLAEFGHLFVDFVEHGRCLGPVEADRRGTGADLLGPQQRRQCARNAAEQRLLRLAGLGALGGLDVVPLRLDARRSDRACRQQRLAVGGEHVGMAPNQLVDHRLQRVGQAEVTGLAAELRDEHRLEDHIAELLADARPVALIQRVEQLARLFQHERAQCGEGLLAVPRTPLGTAQDPHDVDEVIEVGAGGTGHGRMLSFEGCAHG